MLKFVGTFLILTGLMMVGGSAGDCDGKCMEYANTMEEMAMAVFLGVAFVITGGYILLKE